MKETIHKIFCDNCDEELQDWRHKTDGDNGVPRVYMTDLIDTARSLLWAIGKRDLCPNCKPKGKECCE